MQGIIVAGGGVPTGEADANGCFVEPTVVTGVTPNMPLWREEGFGPVHSVRVVASFDKALAAVNDSEYGLSAALFTNNLHPAQRSIDAADTGHVGINLPTSGWDVHQLLSSFKKSGFLLWSRAWKVCAFTHAAQEGSSPIRMLENFFMVGASIGSLSALPSVQAAQGCTGLQGAFDARLPWCLNSPGCSAALRQRFFAFPITLTRIPQKTRFLDRNTFSQRKADVHTFKSPGF